MMDHLLLYWIVESYNLCIIKQIKKKTIYKRLNLLIKMRILGVNMINNVGSKEKF